MPISLLFLVVNSYPYLYLPFVYRGAVALDGRIEPGDMILQVNDINFENMSNDEAVRVLREVVQKPGWVSVSAEVVFPIVTIVLSNHSLLQYVPSTHADQSSLLLLNAGIRIPRDISLSHGQNQYVRLILVLG